MAKAVKGRTKKRVLYHFGNGKANGNATMRERLGGKGAQCEQRVAQLSDASQTEVTVT